MATFKVTLKRNATIGDRTWEHTTKASAQSRAHALCVLHSVREATWDDRALVFTVDATEYYKDSKPSDPARVNSHRKGGF